MNILAFDTSTEWASVAVGDGKRWHACDEHVGQGHAERLLVMVDQTLRAAGCTLRDVDAIAFGAGPGSFTGVRIGCAVAQGLALGADRPVLPVPTLAALAHEAMRTCSGRTIVAALDARMREVYVAAYVCDGADLREIMAPAVLPPARVALPPDVDAAQCTGAGSAFAVYPALGAQLGLSQVHAELRPTARAVAEWALPHLLAGKGVAAGDALPLYVRHRVALTVAERDAGARL